MNITISQAKPIDIKPMATLIRELFTIETDFEINEEKQIQALSLLVPDPACDILIAKDGDRVVGMATMQPVISTAEGGYVGVIEDVIVTAEYRRHHIGSKLVNALIEAGNRRRYKAVKLLADKNNQDAKLFYQTLHFAQTHMMMLRHRM